MAGALKFKRKFVAYAIDPSTVGQEQHMFGLMRLDAERGVNKIRGIYIPFESQDRETMALNVEEYFFFGNIDEFIANKNNRGAAREMFERDYDTALSDKKFEVPAGAVSLSTERRDMITYLLDEFAADGGRDIMAGLTYRKGSRIMCPEWFRKKGRGMGGVKVNKGDHKTSQRIRVITPSIISIPMGGKPRRY